MAGEISVPEDFDQMGREEIERIGLDTTSTAPTTPPAARLLEGWGVTLS